MATPDPTALAAGCARLAKAIVDQRAALGIDSQAALAERSRISPRVLADLERGAVRTYRRSTLVHLERALEWQPGTVDGILASRPPADPSAVQRLDPALPSLAALLAPNNLSLTDYERHHLELGLAHLAQALASLAARGEQPPAPDWPEQRDHNPTEAIPDVSAPTRRAPARRP